MSAAAAEEVAFSQWEVAWVMVERVLVRRGASRKMPAPAVPWPEKKEMPRRSWGWKPPRAVRARLGMVAWKGSAVMLVLELVGWVRIGFLLLGVGGVLTSLIGWSWMCFSDRARRSTHLVSVCRVSLRAVSVVRLDELVLRSRRRNQYWLQV